MKKIKKVEIPPGFVEDITELTALAISHPNGSRFFMVKDFDGLTILELGRDEFLRAQAAIFGLARSRQWHIETFTMKPENFLVNICRETKIKAPRKAEIFRKIRETLKNGV